LIQRNLLRSSGCPDNGDRGDGDPSSRRGRAARLDAIDAPRYE